MRFLAFLLAAFLVCGNLAAQEVTGHKINNDILIVECSFVDFEIRAYTPEVIKVTAYLDKIREDDSSYSVIATPAYVDTEVRLDNMYIYFKTDSLTLRISLDKFGIEFTRDGEVIASQEKDKFFRAYDINGCFFGLKENEAIYGLGSKAVDINRRNLSTHLYNANNFGYEYGDHMLNTNAPLVLSTQNYGIYIDSHSYIYFDSDLIEEDRFRFHVNDGQFAYFFISGDGFDDMLGKYHDLTGYQPLPPRWALGFFMSKITYGSGENSRRVVDWYHNNGFPLDVMVYDYSWFGYSRNLGNFTWDTENYPDPQKMMADFRAKGVKTVLMSEPQVSVHSDNYNDGLERDVFVKYEDGETVIDSILFEEVSLLDIFKKEAKEWIWEKYERNCREGVAGWWVDLVEPENHPIDWHHVTGPALRNHNNYSLVWAENFYKNFRETFPEKRPFLMQRSGWAGSQRFGLAFQVGDEKRSWPGLRGQLPVLLGMQMSGLPIVSTDIGGFAGGGEKFPELYARWFQFGAFNPVMRIHMGGTHEVEPFHFSQKIQNIAKEYIKLRYKLLPYNYTLCWENTAYGMPIARQMNFYDMDNDSLKNINDQYFWGRDFIVAPVIYKGQTQRSVILTEGRWVDYHTKEKYDGDTIVTAQAPLSAMPLFVRAGSFIPTAAHMLTTEEYRSDSLVVEYYPDPEYPETNYKMYDDDGVTPESYSDGDYQFIEFSGKYLEKKIEITQSSVGDYPGAPQSRDMYLKIFDPGFDNYLVKINDEYMPESEFPNALADYRPCYYYDVEDSVLLIHYEFDGGETNIEIMSGINSVPPADEQKKIEIFPDPNHGVINLKTGNLSPGAYTISFYDSRGRSVSGRMAVGLTGRDASLEIDLGKNSEIRKSGVYFIRIEGKGIDISEKFRFVK